MAEWQEKLRKLDKLRKDSLITNEEYDKEKALLMPSEMKKGLLDRLGGKKRILYVLGGFIVISSISSALVRGCVSDENANSPEPMIVESVPGLTPVETPTATSVETPTATSVETPTATSVETPTATSVPSETFEQQEAIEWAKDYMNFCCFSRAGLIDQLVFDGFTLEEATYGVDAQNADWSAQAAQLAQEYLDDCCFARSGLIDQLVFDGFTLEEATYGVDAQNADWSAQAAQLAQDYLDGYPFLSRSELADQLVSDGFTLQQATYGVNAVGL